MVVDIGCNDQWGAAFITLGKKTWNFVNLSRSAGIFAKIKAYYKVQDERRMSSSSKKVSQASQITPVQNMRGQKLEERLRERLNETTSLHIPKKKTGSTPKKWSK